MSAGERRFMKTNTNSTASLEPSKDIEKNLMKAWHFLHVSAAIIGKHRFLDKASIQPQQTSDHQKYCSTGHVCWRGVTRPSFSTRSLRLWANLQIRNLLQTWRQPGLGLRQFGQKRSISQKLAFISPKTMEGWATVPTLIKVEIKSRFLGANLKCLM
jgi:hypothetical protein